ncbi:hypothetical protein MMC20_007288 [Loxospora ochrophaea]|nr:hypothetical protein [Loxospora ochrophaea]
MDHFNDFDAVFSSKPDLAYDQQTIDQILRNRRSLENELFFDRLLKSLGVAQTTQLYPPRSNQDLRNLHERIITAPRADHQKQSLVYYILKDIPKAAQAAQSFADSCFLPKKYQIFIDGIWYLDKLKLEKALEFLTDPSLTPTFPSEILYTLCRHAPPENPTLALTYYHTVSPPLTTTKVLDAFFAVYCRGSITEAFFFSRSQGEHIHRHLFEKLVSFVHAEAGGTIRATRGVELIGLPFNEEEETWFEEYLVEGKGRSLYGAKDSVMMRKILTGRAREAVEFGKDLSGKVIDGVNWTSLMDGLQQDKA